MSTITIDKHNKILEKLTQVKKTREFVEPEQTLGEVIANIFAAYNIEFELSTEKVLPVKTFKQADETDLEFIERELTAEELTYAVEATETGHKVYLIDQATEADAEPGKKPALKIPKIPKLDGIKKAATVVAGVAPLSAAAATAMGASDASAASAAAEPITLSETSATTAAQAEISATAGEINAVEPPAVEMPEAVASEVQPPLAPEIPAVPEAFEAGELGELSDTVDVSAVDAPGVDTNAASGGIPGLETLADPSTITGIASGAGVGGAAGAGAATGASGGAAGEEVAAEVPAEEVAAGDGVAASDEVAAEPSTAAGNNEAAASETTAQPSSETANDSSVSDEASESNSEDNKSSEESSSEESSEAESESETETEDNKSSDESSSEESSEAESESETETEDNKSSDESSSEESSEAESESETETEESKSSDESSSEESSEAESEKEVDETEESAPETTDEESEVDTETETETDAATADKPATPSKPSIPNKIPTAAELAAMAGVEVPTIPKVPNANDLAAMAGVTVPSMPSMPSVPGMPDVPGMPSVPSVPGMPSMPSVPGMPDVPSMPSMPNVPDVSNLGSVPDMPSTPSMPDAPSMPDMPSTPEVPSTPDTPSAPIDEVPKVDNNTPSTTPNGEKSFAEKFAAVSPIFGMAALANTITQARSIGNLEARVNRLQANQNAAENAEQPKKDNQYIVIDSAFIKKDNKQVKDTTVIKLTGKEELSDLFEYQCEIRSRNFNLTEKDVLGKPVALTIHSAKPEVHEDERPVARYVHGIIAAFEVKDVGRYVAASKEDAENKEIGRFYVLKIVPHLQRLVDTQACRVFQHKDQTVKSITELLLKHYEIDYEILIKNPPAKPYCMQYNESDFNFLTRLWADAGWFYFFKHTKADKGSAKHTLVISNQTSGYLKENSGDIVKDKVTDLFSAQVTGKTDALVKYIHLNSKVIAAKYAVGSKNSENPDDQVYGDSETDAPGADSTMFIHLPGAAGSINLDNSDIVQRQAIVHQQREKVGRKVIEGACSIALQVGEIFEWKHKPFLDVGVPKKCVVKAIEWTTQDKIVSVDGGISGMPINCETKVKLIDESFSYIPNKTPVVYPGILKATVVDNKGELNKSDKPVYNANTLGQVCIKFDFEKEAEKVTPLKDAQDKGPNHFDLCVVDILQGASHALYPVGTKVIVDFIGGNPDHPIIVGTCNEGDNLPLEKGDYSEEKNQTISIISQAPAKAQDDKTYNAIVFDDKDDKGGSKFRIEATGDLTTNVAANAVTTIKKDEEHTVEGKYTLKAGGESGAKEEMSAEKIWFKIGAAEFTMTSSGIEMKVGKTVLSVTATAIESKAVDGAVTHTVGPATVDIK